MRPPSNGEQSRGPVWCIRCRLHVKEPPPSTPALWNSPPSMNQIKYPETQWPCGALCEIGKQIPSIEDVPAPRTVRGGGLCHCAVCTPTNKTLPGSFENIVQCRPAIKGIVSNVLCCCIASLLNEMNQRAVGIVMTWMTSLYGNGTMLEVEVFRRQFVKDLMTLII